MIVKFENEFLEVLSSSHGGELISIKGKKDNVEYLWTADSKYWGRHAPILFPIVGRVKDNKYRVEEKEFELGQHGFARDYEFDLLENKDNTIVYRLVSSEESLKKYPYKFQLDIEYKLYKNMLKVTYKVKNIDNEKIYFTIGAHPGFNCPLIKGEDFEDYYLEFNKNENARRELLDKESLLFTGESELVLDNTNILKLSKNLFIQDALIFENLNSNEVTLKSARNGKSISVNFEGFPYLGIWSKPNEAPLICIEPWVGHADPVDFNGDYREKPGVISLDVGKEFTCDYCIFINQD
ncbi:aldose 1-epimerase family protein [Clostridium cibarium]|uniref:Aldose 1-epimerase family protein n=1 Tax=Clostridium cibarium TaxID=2762247 RepID=A0ABR8PSN1_9CLOT|nr:aldose 1-epimerase family protein [Clostridium cibarium]MBD7911172.1 aldose 1-epimerase family protein [Clostridium cibarium]